MATHHQTAPDINHMYKIRGQMSGRKTKTTGWLWVNSNSIHTISRVRAAFLCNFVPVRLTILVSSLDSKSLQTENRYIEELSYWCLRKYLKYKCFSKVFLHCKANNFWTHHILNKPDCVWTVMPEWILWEPCVQPKPSHVIKMYCRWSEGGNPHTQPPIVRNTRNECEAKRLFIHKGC